MTALHILTFIDLLYEDARRTAGTPCPNLDHASRVVNRVRLEAKVDGVSDVRDAFTFIDEYGLDGLQNGTPLLCVTPRRPDCLLRFYANPAPDPEWYWTATDLDRYPFHDAASLGATWERCLRMARTIAVLRGLKPEVNDVAAHFRIHEAGTSTKATS